jgi:hypothetical protein
LREASGERHPFTQTMKNKIRITWEVSDGYAGGSRPHHFSVDPENYRNTDPEDMKTELGDEIQQDFSDKVSWVCDVSEHVQEIQKYLEENPESQP